MRAIFSRHRRVDRTFPDAVCGAALRDFRIALGRPQNRWIERTQERKVSRSNGSEGSMPMQIRAHWRAHRLRELTVYSFSPSGGGGVLFVSSMGSPARS